MLFFQGGIRAPSILRGFMAPGTPEDLSGPVVFLASEASVYVNGYTLAVDGDWLAR